MNVFHRFLTLLYPPVCPFCGQVGEGICSRCRQALPVVREPFCMKCGKPLDDENEEFCHDCKRRYHAYDQGRALYPHKGAMKQAVYDLKYAGRRVNGEIFGRELARHFEGWIRARQITMIVPVPLHRNRLRERGYNQAAVIAGELAREVMLPCREDVLTRTRKTKRLKTMERTGRMRALEGAFAADLAHCAQRERRNILLIDDIYTTGSTVDQAAKCLKRAGAEHVYFLTVTIGEGQ